MSRSTIPSARHPPTRDIYACEMLTNSIVLQWYTAYPHCISDLILRPKPFNQRSKRAQKSTKPGIWSETYPCMGGVISGVVGLFV